MVRDPRDISGRELYPSTAERDCQAADSDAGSLYQHSRSIGEDATYRKDSPRTRPVSTHKSLRLTYDGEAAQSIHVVAIFARDREILTNRERPSEPKMHVGFCGEGRARDHVTGKHAGKTMLKHKKDII